MVEELRRALMDIVAEHGYLEQRSDTPAVETIPRWALQSIEASAALAIAEVRRVTEVVGAAADSQGGAEAWADARRILTARGVTVSIPSGTNAKAATVQSLFAVQLRAGVVSAWALVRGPLTQMTLEVLQGPRGTSPGELRLLHRCRVQLPAQEVPMVRILGPALVSCKVPDLPVSGGALWLAAEQRGVVAAVSSARPVSRIGVQTASPRWRDAINLVGADQLNELREDLVSRLGVLPIAANAAGFHIVEQVESRYVSIARNPLQAQNLLNIVAAPPSGVFTGAEDNCGRPDGLSWNGVTLSNNVNAIAIETRHHPLVRARTGDVLGAAQQGHRAAVFAVPTLNGAIEPSAMVATVRCIATVLRDMNEEPPISGSVNLSDLSGSRILWGLRERFDSSRRNTARDFTIALLLALAWAGSAILHYPLGHTATLSRRSGSKHVTLARR